MADPNPKKVEGEPEPGTTVLDSETLPANVDSAEVAEVFNDKDHAGVTGSALAASDRPQLFKLDHKKGFIHPFDDDEEKYDSLVGVVVNARTSYRRFGPNGPCCESDNGVTGYDQDLKREIKCKEECKLSYALDTKVDGQCGLGVQIQLLADMDGDPLPLQFTGSSTSARNFATYLAKLKRKKKPVRSVTTKISARFIKGKKQDYYAAKYEVESDTPCFDISALTADDPDPDPDEQPEN